MSVVLLLQPTTRLVVVVLAGTMRMAGLTMSRVWVVALLPLAQTAAPPSGVVVVVALLITA